MKDVEREEMQALSALRGPFLDARRTISSEYFATVLSRLELTQGRPARWPARRLVRPSQAQKKSKPLKVGTFMPGSGYEMLKTSMIPTIPDKSTSMICEASIIH